MRNRLKSIAFIILALWSMLVFAVNMSEYVIIGLVKNPEIVSAYHFGSEPMVGHGGSKYKSAESYSTVALVWSAISGVLFVLCFTFFGRKRYKRLAVAISILGLYSVILWLFQVYVA